MKDDIYNKTLDATVFPSEAKTIAVKDDKEYGGAHQYEIVECKGFSEGKHQYTISTQRISFVHKADDGSMTPGLQSEQLVLMLLDRTQKLNARFPSEQNEKMMAGLQMFLDACKERVQDRIDRGVMGDLKK
jgi:hypothetical protein